VDNYICIHAHFYQPPRENPWLETIEYQDSAHPYHDWNQRITAECYRPNAVSRILDSQGRIDQIINNYSRISFNFGPTLLSWLESADREMYDLIIEGDKESRKRFSGHGSAIAQAYNHAILPLCNERDKITQIGWGIRDFHRRFGRDPESLWLPETAVDLETLDIMAQMGLKYAILAPHQAKRVRKRGERTWRAVVNQNIDPSMAYEIHLPTGRRMALFFYDGPISRAVGFERLLSDGGNFANRLISAFSAERKWPQLVHIATDGETYGHHHKFGDMALSYALHSIETGSLARLTNYGEFLEKHPPTQLVEIVENTSWSCAHGIGRWKENCGCNTGSHPGWSQQWRAPMREALDWLRDHLTNLYDDEAINYLQDPWAARNDYIDVILDRAPEKIDSFLAAHRVKELSQEDRVRTLKLMELQRHAMLMYTSCGWFFDEISGIEAVQNFQYAGRAIQLGEDLCGKDTIETAFLEILQKAASNVPELENGRKIYEIFVKPAVVDMSKAAGHYAVSSLFQNYPDRSEIYSYFVDRESSKTLVSGKTKLALGRCRITSKITLQSSIVEYGVIHLGDHNIRGGVRLCEQANAAPDMMDDLASTFERADLPGVYRLINFYFGQSVFSLRSLFRDEQREVLDIILKSTNADLEALNQQAFERTGPLMRFLMHLGFPLPPLFKNIANAAIRAQLQHAFETTELNEKAILDLFESAKFWRIDLDAEGLAFTLRETIEKLARESRDNPGELRLLKRWSDSVRLTSQLPFIINFYGTQNTYYDILLRVYPELKTASERGDENAQAWTDEFRALGDMLSVKVK
jgi:alpha-amylase/alpha-mannosidase (GH57 family)